MDYPKSVPSVGLVDGKFVDDNPLTGTPGSLIPAEWGNAVTDEILSVIRSTNAVPAENNNTQLTDAIVSIADLRVSQAISKSVAPATEIVSGVAKVATQTQTSLGVDDTTIVTPKKMAGAVQSQALVAFTTAGAAPQFTLAPVPAITAYTVNQRFQVKFHSGGAGSDKMNISGLGPKNIMQYDASGNKVAAVIQGQLTDAVYDGTDIVLLDSLPNAFGVTPAQFDNSTKLATTAFVQGVGFQFSNTILLSASAVLTASPHAGSLIVSVSTSMISVSLPLASTVPAKSVIKFWSFGSGGMTIIVSGTDAILAPAATTTFPLLTGAWITLASNGVTGWYVVDVAGLGLGQTWQNVLANRAAVTTYTNSTGRPIVVTLGISARLNYTLIYTLNGVAVNMSNAGSVTAISASVSFIVPPGNTYSCNGLPETWLELR